MAVAHIHLIEDDEGVREQLAALLRHAGHEVEVAVRFDRLADDVLAAAPDLVVLDLGLPGTDGLYVARDLRRRSSVAVLVLTSRASELDELSSLAVGADDFVSKDANPQVLLAHVDALLRRAGVAAQAGGPAWAGLSLDLARSTASYGGRTVELTKNELRILDLLVRAQGAIVSRERLMEALWATDAFVDDNTLTVNVNRLRATLGLIGADGLVATHRGQGYALRDDGGHGAPPWGSAPAGGGR